MNIKELYSNLTIFRNELKNATVYKYKIIGIIATLIMGEFFKTQVEMKSCMVEIFNIEDDIINLNKNDMLIKVIEIINNENIDKKELKNICKKLYKTVDEKTEEIRETGIIKAEKNPLDAWIR